MSHNQPYKFLIQGLIDSDYALDGRRNPTRGMWMEDPVLQSKTCVICHKPVLLADWLVTQSHRASPKNFVHGMTCSTEGDKTCANTLEQMSRKSRYPELDQDLILSLLRDFRVSLGLEEGDTPTTFKPWDLIKMTEKDVHNPDTPLIPSSTYHENDEWRALVNYVFSLSHDDRKMLLGRSGQTSFSPNLTSDYRMKNGQFIYRLFYAVSKDEFLSAPLWTIPRHMKMTLGRTMKSKGVAIDIYAKFNEELLFEKMKEVFPNGLTFRDYVSFCRHSEYRRMIKHWWFPTLFNNNKTHGIRKYTSYWEFIFRLHRYMNRDEKGRFLPASFTRLDYLVWKHDTHRSKGMSWTRKDIRDWVLRYVFPKFVQIDHSAFPENSTEAELQEVINLTTTHLQMVDGYSKVVEVLKLNQEDCGNGIKKIVSYAWPNYKMVQAAWTRAVASEKHGNIMLEKVFAHGDTDDEYTHGETTALVVGENDKALYNITHNFVRVDGRLGRRLAIEFQGCYHYVDKHALVEEGVYDDTLFLQSDIPKKMIEYCKANGIRTPLGYRQYLDRECRTKAEESGYGTPVYIILSRYAYAVEGVHGDIPMWNRQYVTDPKHSNSIGLAETFDMQGHEAIGDMVRKYYHEVVCA
jgi:hypothetical protein